MKRRLFQLFNLLMACIVLLSSTGFGLVEHSCQMRGKKKTMVVAFSKDAEQKGCKIGKHTAINTDELIISRDECCQDEQSYENVDVTSSLTQLVAKFAKIVTEAVLTSVLTVVTWLVDWIFDHSVATSAPAVSSPSLPSGRDLLSLVQRFLI
ncbi:HYC_CC_PP family protein [Spirosoma sp. KUDC1026]|uniref:HYC_CC_PP family protein n=1 Tax=Spirosoma sp. KUDC1026 TaxID=2745947 RepID=UPI00159BC968|nr:hypothetical protein [Spirosoma sp. KUDC1026]QKZ14061.1 hypothetical protein HU175_16060 [Spirosoma sp. KUDC1026]